MLGYKQVFFLIFLIFFLCEFGSEQAYPWYYISWSDFPVQKPQPYSMTNRVSKHHNILGIKARDDDILDVNTRVPSNADQVRTLRYRTYHHRVIATSVDVSKTRAAV